MQLSSCHALLELTELKLWQYQQLSVQDVLQENTVLEVLNNLFLVLRELFVLLIQRSLLFVLLEITKICKEKVLA